MCRVNETWEVAEAKVKQAIQEQLGIDVDIERAHRVERRNRDRSSQDTQQGKSRTIVCKLRCWKQREAVLKKARKSKPSGLFISEDLALATLQRRVAQVGKLREAKQAGKIAYFVLDRLVIRDKKIPPNQDVSFSFFLFLFYGLNELPFFPSRR